MTLYHDTPSSTGVANALKRAKQLVEFRWTAVNPFPAGQHIQTSEATTGRVDLFLRPWRPRNGITYSSVRKAEKYVGLNVSLETYATAIANPRSVIYTRSQHGLGLSMWNYYGVVCSVFATYVLDLPLRRTCPIWTNFQDSDPVDSSALENLQLCDILLNPTRHVAIITGIERDAEGKVHYITVSEATSPFCISTRFSVREFLNYWLNDGYSVYRYKGIDTVPAAPCSYIALDGDFDRLSPYINPSLLPNFGNKANYMLGEEVELDVFEDRWTAVRITGPEERTIPIRDAAAIFRPRVPGFYTARCTDGAAESDPVEFCITHIEITGDRRVWKTGDPFILNFCPAAPEDQVIGWIIHNTDDSLRGTDLFTEVECATGSSVIYGKGKASLTEKQPLEPGVYYIFVLARNKFGTYKSGSFDFRVEAPS